MRYEDQLSAARFKAERDIARQEVKELREELDAASKDAAERSKILEAARWVRDHGGLAHVMDIVNDFRAVVERIGVEWSESELHIIMDVLDSRLMPEDMEWPRYESGDPVPIGGEFMGKDGKTYTAKQIQFIGKCFSLYDFCDRKPQFNGFYGERVKRPAVLAADGEPLERGLDAWWICEGDDRGIHAERLRVERIGEDGLVECSPYNGGTSVVLDPAELYVKKPVLDADGVEVELGDDLYSVEGSLKFHVSHVDRSNGKIATDAMFAIDKWADPSMFTHRAPVLAADGKPLCEGETVWDTLGNRRFKVVGFDPLPEHEEYAVETVGVDGMPIHGWSKPSDLTHDRPVLDADGVPIKVGDTVYGFSEQEYEVTGLCEYEPSIVHARDVGDGVASDELIAMSGALNSCQLDASKLTHTKPDLDTWERIEEDAEKDPCGYFGFDGEETCGKCPASAKNCEQTMACDLVRRAKALAERERGE